MARRTYRFILGAWCYGVLARAIARLVWRGFKPFHRGSSPASGVPSPHSRQPWCRKIERPFGSSTAFEGNLQELVRSGVHEYSSIHVLPIYLHDGSDRVRVLFWLLKKHCAEKSVRTLPHLYATNKHLDLISVFSEVLTADCDLGADICHSGGKDRCYIEKRHV